MPGSAGSSTRSRRSRRGHFCCFHQRQWRRAVFEDLALCRPQMGPAGGRSAGAADLLVAGAYQGRQGDGPGVHHDGFDRDLPGRGQCRGRCRLSARRDGSTAGVDRRGAGQRAHPLLADGQPQPAGGPPRRLEIFEGAGQEFLFDIGYDPRERGNMARKRPDCSTSFAACGRIGTGKCCRCRPI